MLTNQSMGYNPLENILNNRQQYNTKNLDLSSITDFLASQGRNGDTMLAHITPQEAEMLKQMGGSGTINPNTGLPEFFLDKVLGIVGAIVGNAVLPGFGGIIGGSLGSMAGEGLNKGFKITEGKPNYLKTGLMGAGIGAALPSAASLGGGIANAVGAKSLGTTLSNYGTANSITAALGLNGGKGYTGPIDFLTNAGKSGGASTAALGLNGGKGYTGPIDFLTNAGKSGGAGGAIDLVAKGSGAASEVAKGAAEKGFLDNLISNPTNLLMGVGLAANYFGREKPKSPTQLGLEQKAYQQAMKLTPAEEKAKLERELQYYEMKKQKEREERRKNREDWESTRNAINPLVGGMGFNRVINSPETYAKTGRWMEYEPVKYAKGGIVDAVIKKKEPIVKQTITRILIPLNSFGGEHFFDNEDFDKPEKFATGKFLDGDTHGQEDKIHALLSDGEYVINASRVADLGDGNNKAGAKFLDKFLKSVAEYKSHNPKKKIPPSILNKKISYFVNQG